MKCFVYPYVNGASKNNNPYIEDFVLNIERQGWEVSNKNIKGNPLFILWRYVFKSDVFIFHWIENVPVYKYGFLQYLYAVGSIYILKILNKKIIWFKHNKKPHNLNNSIQYYQSKHLSSLITQKASLIFTHSQEGLILLKKWANKSFFIMHPTKDRLTDAPISYIYDVLIWGSISKYKGVVEFVKAHASNEELGKLKIKIIGKCEDMDLFSDIENSANDNIDFEARPINFEELKSYLGKVKHVLIPYKSETILSSGILMDSLSFGFSVIGPKTAVFSELSSDKRVVVNTFDTFLDITKIIGRCNRKTNYQSFLVQYSWTNVIKELINKIESFK